MGGDGHPHQCDLNHMETDNPTGLNLGVIWFDDDMIELECKVAYHGFQGVATCYTIQEDIIEFSGSLDQLAQSADGSVSFDSGLEDGSKSISLRAYPIDRSGHLAIHLRMATDNHANRPEGVWRVELEMRVESSPLSRFASGLRSVAESREGFAFLQAAD